jgi:bifunctional DNA-binding transcriptional regulator/antitoxin component of YhaV-PrlF toxin-antitoxin module
MPGSPEPESRSLGFVAVQARSGTITIPAEARRALRLDSPGAQVEVVLRDHDMILIPHLAVSLERLRQADAHPPEPSRGRRRLSQARPAS